MNKYAQVAVKALEIIESQKTSDPIAAWDISSCIYFAHGSPSQKKGCPRNTFLSICETGLVKRIESGQYTKSKKNKSYAIKALKLLQQDPSLASDPDHLWCAVQGGNKIAHNSQMDVVIAVWRHCSNVTN